MIAYLGCSGLLSKEAEYSRTSSHIQDHLVPKVCKVRENGFLVGGRPHKVLHHVLLLREVAVKLEVLSCRRLFGSRLEN